MADKVRILVDVQERRSGMPGLLEALGAEVEVLSLTARALLEQFGSLAVVAAASPEELLEVPGIGKERARSLADALGHAE